MQTESFTVNGVTLSVTADYDALRKTLEGLKPNFEEGVFTTAFSTDEGNVTKDEYLEDIEAMENLLTRIESDPSLLEKHVTALRKKKNGRFWSNSGATIDQMDNVSTYFTDFTNAWRVWQLRLEVWTEDTAQLVLRNRTETY